MLALNCAQPSKSTWTAIHRRVRSTRVTMAIRTSTTPTNKTSSLSTASTAAAASSVLAEEDVEASVAATTAVVVTVVTTTAKIAPRSASCARNLDAGLPVTPVVNGRDVPTPGARSKQTKVYLTTMRLLAPSFWNTRATTWVRTTRRKTPLTRST